MKKEIYYNAKGEVDHIATWLNNSKWSWVIPVILFLLCGLVEGL